MGNDYTSEGVAIVYVGDMDLEKARSAALVVTGHAIEREWTREQLCEALDQLGLREVLRDGQG